MVYKKSLYINSLLLSLMHLSASAQTPTFSNVTKLYVATFKRAPDSSGLNYWVNESRLSLEEIAQSFFEQPETQELYPKGYSNHEFVRAVYQNPFDREPDPQGWRYWERELDSGNISRSNLILATINGARDDDAILLANKSEVGEYYAEAGLNDIDEAYKVISMVDVSSSSVYRAKRYIDSISSSKDIDRDMTYNWSIEERQALRYLSKIRTMLGMKPFSAQSQLHTAALNHSKYLILNNEIGHREDSNKVGFTGEWPLDRGLEAGYPAKIVSENYASVSGYEQNIETLFTAIYHRLGFLSFSKDEIGIGIYESNGKSAYTYDMGNSSLREFCESGKSVKGDGRDYYICINPNIKLPQDKYNSYSNTQPNLDYVVYPTGKITNGIFTSESPYPIPGYSFSGNPISVSFNPYNVDCSSIVMKSFKVKDLTEDRVLDTITIMDSSNDPNGRFSECDFALFPSEREKFGHRYKATFKYEDSSGEHTIKWSFSIATPSENSENILEATNISNRFTINAGEDYYIYVPPSDDYPLIKTYNYTYNQIELNTFRKYDPNTIHIKVDKDATNGHLELSINNKYIYLDVK